MSGGHWLQTFGVELPVIQAPLAGAQDDELAGAVAAAGGLGSLPCSMLTAAQAVEQVERFRQRTPAPLNLNFVCHRPPPASEAPLREWRARLEHYYQELGVVDAPPGAVRRPFDDEMCAVVERLRPAVVSFHFGLPEPTLVARVKATGARIISTATTVAEARALEQAGVHAIIAQGAEAGGHRGHFLNEADDAAIGTLALVPQVVDAVGVPVIAAGGIADARGVAAAQALGASAVQVGTAYLHCRQSRISDAFRAQLEQASDDATRLTNVFTGRSARGLVNRALRELGPIATHMPPYPLAALALAPLRSHAEASGSGDFSPLWAGQAVALQKATDATALTRLLGAGWR